MGNPKADRHLATVDAMPRELRRVVHDFGLAPVHAMLEVGVKDAALIRHAIVTARVGAREYANKPRNAVKSLIDDVLTARGCPPLAREIIAQLRQLNLTVTTLEPTDQAVAASMAALDGMGMVSKPTKHRKRLRAALRAQDAAMWGPRT